MNNKRNNWEALSGKSNKKLPGKIIKKPTKRNNEIEKSEKIERNKEKETIIIDNISINCSILKKTIRSVLKDFNKSIFCSEPDSLIRGRNVVNTKQWRALFNLQKKLACDNIFIDPGTLEKKNKNYVLNNGKFLIKILENKYKTVEAQLITQYSIKVAVSKTNIYKKISESSSIDIETVSSILNEYKKFIHPFEKTVSSTNIGRNIVNGRQWNELLQLQQKLIKKGIHINPNSLEKQDKLYLVDNGKYIIKFSEYRNTKKEFSAKIINQETFKIGK